jgi:hypothetical protein
MIELVEEDHCTGYRGLWSEEGVSNNGQFAGGVTV